MSRLQHLASPITAQVDAQWFRDNRRLQHLASPVTAHVHRTVVWIWSHDELVLNRNRCPAFSHQLGHSVDGSRCKCLTVEVPRPFARHHSCSHIPVTPSAHARTRMLPSVAPVAVIAGLSFQLSALASMSSHRIRSSLGSVFFSFCLL